MDHQVMLKELEQNLQSSPTCYLLRMANLLTLIHNGGI